MKKFQLLTGTGLLALTVAVAAHAFSGFDIAPKKSPTASDRMPRTLDKPMETFSKKPMKATRGISPKADASGPVIYGMMLYSDDWYNLDEDESYPYGCYAFSKDQTTPSAMLVHPNLYANGGGCYTSHQVNYHLYGISSDSSDDYSFLNYYMVVNTDEWSYVQDPILTDENSTIANDMTYDPISKNIYAAAWGNFEGGNTRLAIVDQESGECDEIATLPDMACIVCNNFGELYGVELLTGTAYRINKTTGEYIAIGQTGISPKYAQSACVDPETNKIYWAASLDDGTAGVYTLNTTTGKADLYFDLPGNEEFSCVFIEADTKGLNAPAELVDFSAISGGDNSTVSFTVPTKAFDGSALSGSLTAKTYCDGIQVDSRSVAAGDKVSFAFTPGEGDHTIVAFVENSVGEGPKTIINHYTGADLPAAPSNLTLSVNNGVASLSWNAPTAGLHGGTIDPSTLTYNVTRYPGATDVAYGLTSTSFSETLPSEMANYYYVVTALSNGEAGGSATSNSYFAGTAYTVPYSQSFDDANSLKGFTLLDGDGDGYTWAYSTYWSAVWSRFNSTEQENDWLITPPISFKANATYQVSFRARAFDADSTEKFEVLAGKEAQPEAMTTTIISSTSTNSETYATYSGEFKTEADGIMYIGFHAMSAANSYRLLVDDIEIKLTAASDIPAAVTDLTATAASDGSTVVTLEFTAPSKLHNGDPLSSLSAVNIYRGTSSTPVHVIQNPTPGQKITWVDDNAEEGLNQYRVCGVNEAGNGVEASVSVYVGYDVPLAPTNLKLQYTDDKDLVLSWTPPTKGENGATLTENDVWYIIYRVCGSDAEAVATGVTGSSYTDSSLADETEQKMVYYQITPYCGSNAGYYALSDFVVIGDALSVPFAESFQEQGLDNTPWIISRISGQTDMCWTLNSEASNPDATAQDGDSGFATFVSYGKQRGIMERLTSPKIDLFCASHPVLKFWLYQTTSAASESLTVQISNNDNNFISLDSFSIKGDSEGWKEYSVEIPRKYCTENAMISFLGTTAGSFNIHLDNISIENDESNLDDYDLEAVSLDVPDLMPDTESALTLTVYNNGSKAIENYSVALLVNGEEAISANATEAIEAGETYYYIFRLTPEQSDLGIAYDFRGKVSSALDSNYNNNMTDVVTKTIGVSSLDEIELDANASTEVFTLDGIRIKQNAEKCDIKELPAGTYIIKSGARSYKLRK